MTGWVIGRKIRGGKGGFSILARPFARNAQIVAKKSLFSMYSLRYTLGASKNSNSRKPPRSILNPQSCREMLGPEHQCSKAARKQRSSCIVDHSIRQSILGGLLEDRFELRNGLKLLLLSLAVGSPLVESPTQNLRSPLLALLPKILDHFQHLLPPRRSIYMLPRQTHTNL